MCLRVFIELSGVCVCRRRSRRRKFCRTDLYCQNYFDGQDVYFIYEGNVNGLFKHQRKERCPGWAGRSRNTKTRGVQSFFK